MRVYEPDLGVNSCDTHDRGNRPSRQMWEPRSSPLCCGCTRQRVATRGTTAECTLVVANSASCSGEEGAVSYRVTLRDRATQTVVGYYDGSWTTDRRRALELRKREMAEAHAGACASAVRAMPTS